MKYSVEVSRYNNATGIAEQLQYDVFESSNQKVAYQRRVMESVVAEEHRPILTPPNWVNDILNPDGTINPVAKIDPKDQSNLRCSKIAFGENGDRYHLIVQAAPEDAEVTVKTKTTSNAEQIEFLVIVEELEDDEAKVVSEETVIYASEGGVKHALKEKGTLDDYSEDKWSKHPRGGIYRDKNDGNGCLIIRRVTPEKEG